MKKNELKWLEQFLEQDNMPDTDYVAAILDDVDNCILFGLPDVAAILFAEAVMRNHSMAVAHEFPTCSHTPRFIEQASLKLYPHWECLSSFWRNNLIMEAIKSRDYEKADRLIDSERLIRPWDAELMAQSVFRHQMQGNLRTALAYIDWMEKTCALITSGNYPEFYHNIQLTKLAILSDLGEDNSVERLSSAYESSDPDRGCFYYAAKSFFLRNSGDYEAGLTAAFEALRLSHNDPTALFQCGWFLRAMGRTVEADRYFDLFMALPPSEDKDSYEPFVYCYHGDNDAAISIVENRLAMKGDDAEAHYVASEIYSLTGDVEKAVVHLKKATDLGHGGLMNILLDPALANLRGHALGVSFLQSHIAQTIQRDESHLAQIATPNSRIATTIKAPLRRVGETDAELSSLPYVLVTIDDTPFNYLIATSLTRTFVFQSDLFSVSECTPGSDHYSIVSSALRRPDMLQQYEVYNGSSYMGMEVLLNHMKINGVQLPPIHVVQSQSIGYYIGQDLLSRFDSVTIYGKKRKCLLGPLPALKRAYTVDVKWACGLVFVECGLGNRELLADSSSDEDDISVETIALIDTLSVESYMNSDFINCFDEEDIPVVRNGQKPNEDPQGYYVDFDLFKLGGLVLHNITFRLYSSPIDVVMGYDIIGSFTSFTIDNRNCKAMIVR